MCRSSCGVTSTWRPRHGQRQSGPCPDSATPSPASTPSSVSTQEAAARETAPRPPGDRETTVPDLEDRPWIWKNVTFFRSENVTIPTPPGDARQPLRGQHAAAGARSRSSGSGDQVGNLTERTRRLDRSPPEGNGFFTSLGLNRCSLLPWPRGCAWGRV